MRGSLDHVCGCFPTGRHYPGIADRIARAVEVIEGLCHDFEASMPWAEIPIAVVDFETTGRDPVQDRVVEVGVARFVGGALVDRHGLLVNPGIPIAKEATNVHGISDADVADQPPFAQRLPELLELLAGYLPVAYNADFDRAFLHAEFGRCASEVSAPLPPALQPQVLWVDPLVWARELLRDLKSRTLGDVCTHLGIDLSNAHRAADDAEATGRVLLRLAEQMPRTYGELVRLQARYGARHEAEMSAWRNRKKFR
jgi:DNA polymerase III subunit epsilon